MKYFKDCTSLEEVKAMYKRLAKENHPDCGGSTEIMQAINVEYSFACAKVLKGENLTAEEASEGIRLSEEYRAVIELLIALPGIVIEVVGHWIWVTGETYSLRKELKAAGLFYASKKIAWYYRADEYKTTGSKKSLDEIRDKYGSETIHSNRKSKVLE